MQHNFLFPKVASPSQCASLWRDMWHARIRWLCWQIFRTFFRPAIRSGALPRGSRIWCKLLPIYSSSIWHKAFDPPRRAPATIWRNPRQQNHSPAHCSNSGPHMTLEMAWRTRLLQLVLSGGPVTPTPIREYNGLRGENRDPFKGQQASESASNPVMTLDTALRSVVENDFIVMGNVH